MSLIQIVQVKVEVNRVPLGERPVYKLELNDNRRIIGVAHEDAYGSKHRQTNDWTAWLWVEVRAADEAESTNQSDEGPAV